MASRRSFQLARIFGIRIGVGISWFVVLFFFIFAVTKPFHEMLGGSRTTAYLVAVASVLSFFVSLIMHELGHALVARREGLTVAGIDLWAFGGITRTSESNSPGVEFRVAVAGPLVTLAVIACCILAGRLVAGSGKFFDVAVARFGTHATPALVWLGWVATINALVLVFNLVPAFPLDGGRIARSIVWKITGDRNRATRFSAYVGQGFAGLMIFVGFWAVIAGPITVLGLGLGTGDGIWLAVLGWLLGQSARAAMLQTAVTSRLAGVTVADIMDADPVTIPADLPATQAYDDFFLRYQGWPWFAVIEADGHFSGLAHREVVEAAAQALSLRPISRCRR
jgi:Zn-dependent protease